MTSSITTDKFKILHDHPEAQQKLTHNITKSLKLLDFNIEERHLIILCIGSDRSTGDALGPLVGTMLTSSLVSTTNPSIAVFGTLQDPIHALNLDATLNNISNTYTNPLTVAIDACLGQTHSIGQIHLGAGGLRPGAGVKKSLPTIGNLHLAGVVNIAGFMEYFVLQNTRLHIVMNMAKVISASLAKSIHHLVAKPTFAD